MRRLLRSGKKANEQQGQRDVGSVLPSVGRTPAFFAMNDMLSVGRRLVVRVVLLQAGCAVVVALGFGILQSAAALRSALLGGLIVAIGSALFGWRLFAPGIAPAALLRRALFAAESLKWVWYVASVWVALAHLKMLPLPLMTGLVLAQFGYWFGLLGKRG